MMKRHFKIFLFVVLLLGVVSITGCMNKKSLVDTDTVSEVEEVLDMSKYNKEVVSYQLKVDEANLKFGLAKDLGYQEKSNSGSKIVLENSNNLSTIEVKFLHKNKDDSEISKDESDFDLNKYYNYSTVEFGKASGWQVFYEENKTNNYQGTFKLTEEDNKGLVYATIINIKQSAKKDGNSFNVQTFTNSVDFQYLLSSMKVDTQQQ